MIHYELVESVAHLTIDRTEKYNALTLKMRGELRDWFAAIRDDRAVRSVLLSAAGNRAFCAGADVAQLGSNDTRRDFEEYTNPLILNLHRIGKPVVCAVNGIAAGLGWSLVLASDVVIACDDAKFSQVFRNIALAPDSGASWLLPRLIGLTRARELILSARFISANEAKALGLVQEVVSEQNLHRRAAEIAREFASGPTLAFAGAKELLASSMFPSLEEHLAREADVNCHLVNTRDHRNAVDAFAAKRMAEFKGE